jgi:hypothetical protein
MESETTAGFTNALTLFLEIDGIDLGQSNLDFLVGINSQAPSRGKRRRVRPF